MVKIDIRNVPEDLDKYWNGSFDVGVREAHSKLSKVDITLNPRVWL